MQKFPNSFPLILFCVAFFYYFILGIFSRAFFPLLPMFARLLSLFFIHLFICIFRFVRVLPLLSQQTARISAKWHPEFWLKLFKVCHFGLASACLFAGWLAGWLFTFLKFIFFLLQSKICLRFHCSYYHHQQNNSRQM